MASYTGFYGLAFAQIYTVEDSRLQAARFIAERVPPGAVIGFERGGFSMDALVRGPRNPTRQLATATLFEARGYSTCRTDVDYLDNRLRDLDHIALIDANRYRQFTAAPDLTPAAAAFYRRLLAGELGFRVAGRFKNYPSLLGIEFRDDDAEPSFISYDHPAVYVLQRESPDAVAAALAALAQSLERDPHCPDAPLQEIAAAMLSADWSRAEALIDRFAQDHPHAALAPMLRADIYRQTDRAEALHTARQRVKDRAQHRAAHVIPWAAGMGLLDIGLDDLAASAITEGTLKSPHFPPWAARDLAKAYILLANYAYDRGSEELAFAAYQQSSQIDPSPAAFNRLAFLAFRRGDYPLAVAFWARSVELVDDQAGIHSNLGQVHAQHLGDYPRALHHLRQAMHYDPRQRRELMPWVEMVQRKMAPEH
jgi:tetratricopeptide (TPR) repeat protein